MALCFTTITINKDYYLWKILLPFGFFSILWIDSWDLFATWSSLSLEISLIGFDVFSKFSFVFSKFLTLFTRLCKLCCVWQSLLTTFLNRGFPCTNQNISFLNFIWQDYKSLNSLQSWYSIGLCQSGSDHVYFPAVYNPKETSRELLQYKIKTLIWIS